MLLILLNSPSLTFEPSFESNTVMPNTKKKKELLKIAGEFSAAFLTTIRKEEDLEKTIYHGLSYMDSRTLNKARKKPENKNQKAQTALNLGKTKQASHLFAAYAKACRKTSIKTANIYAKSIKNKPEIKRILLPLLPQDLEEKEIKALEKHAPHFAKLAKLALEK